MTKHNSLTIDELRWLVKYAESPTTYSTSPVVGKAREVIKEMEAEEVRKAKEEARKAKPRDKATERKLIEIAEMVIERYPKYGAEYGEYGDYCDSDHTYFYNEEDGALRVHSHCSVDDANIHLILNGKRLVISYDQMTAPMKYLDRAEAYAIELAEGQE